MVYTGSIILPMSAQQPGEFETMRDHLGLNLPTGIEKLQRQKFRLPKRTVPTARPVAPTTKAPFLSHAPVRTPVPRVQPNTQPLAPNLPTPAPMPASTARPGTMDTLAVRDPKQHLDPQDIVAEWMSPAYVLYPKDNRWYLYAGLVFSALFAFALFTQAWIMAALVIALAVALFFFSRREPQHYQVVVHRSGIIFGEQSFDFNKLQGFWIETAGQQHYLVLRNRKWYNTKMEITLPETIDLENLFVFLTEHLPEDPTLAEDAVDRIGHYLRI